MADAEQRFGELSRLLKLQLATAVPDWVRRCVLDALDAEWRRTGVPWSSEQEAEILRDAAKAGWEAARQVALEVDELAKTADRAVQVTPLTIVRGVVRFPAEVLRKAGVPPLHRDHGNPPLVRPDWYDLGPRSLAELHPLLPGLAEEWEVARSKLLNS